MTDEARQDTGFVSIEQPRRLGRYLLCTELAAGGMGRVYLGRIEGARGFEKLVAIKLIHRHFARERMFVDMFLDEARISSRVAHPNVCSVFDFGEENGVLYLVMEYLAGQPTASIIGALEERPGLRESPLYFPLLAHVIAQACEGLHAVHTLPGDDGEPMQIVHRDISPENLFVTYDGAVQVMDFGIAHASGRLHQTKPGEFKGKMAYAAPEQFDGVPAAPTVDVWSTGVVLWELLTHQHLFLKETETATLAAVVRDEIPPPSAIAPDVPAALDQVVMRALERDPAGRYATAREMAAELNAFVASRRVHIGMAEVGDWMRHLFPEEHAKTNALMRRARQLDAHLADDALPVDRTMVGERPQPRSGVRVSESADGSGAPAYTQVPDDEPATVEDEPSPATPGPYVGAAAGAPVQAAFDDEPTRVDQDPARAPTVEADPSQAAAAQPAPAQPAAAQPAPAQPVPAQPGAVQPGQPPGPAPPAMTPPPASTSDRGRRVLGIALKVGFAVVALGGGAFAAHVLTSGDATEEPTAPAESAAPADDEGTAGSEAAETDDTAAAQEAGEATDGQPEAKDDTSSEQAAAGSDEADDARSAQDTTEREPDETDDERAGSRRARRMQRRRAAERRAAAEPGTVSIFVSGGYAEVFEGGHKLGGTPGRFELPAGRHVLTLRPSGDAEPIRKVVRVRPGENTKVSVSLD